MWSTELSFTRRSAQPARSSELCYTATFAYGANWGPGGEMQPHHGTMQLPAWERQPPSAPPPPPPSRALMEVQSRPGEWQPHATPYWKLDRRTSTAYHDEEPFPGLQVQ